jgi:hypothetical protein
LALDGGWGVIAERLDAGLDLRMKIEGSKTHKPFFLQCTPRMIQEPSLRFVTADPAWPVAIRLRWIITRTKDGTVRLIRGNESLQLHL